MYPPGVKIRGVEGRKNKKQSICVLIMEIKKIVVVVVVEEEEDREENKNKVYMC